MWWTRNCNFWAFAIKVAFETFVHNICGTFMKWNVLSALLKTEKSHKSGHKNDLNMASSEDWKLSHAVRQFVDNKVRKKISSLNNNESRTKIFLFHYFTVADVWVLTNLKFSSSIPLRLSCQWLQIIEEEIPFIKLTS